MGFPAAFYSPVGCGGAGTLDTLSLNGPAICCVDWGEWVHQLGFETMGTNDQVGDAPGTLGNPKRPAESALEFEIWVVGDVNQAGVSYLSGSEVTFDDAAASVSTGFDANLAVLNAVCAPVTTTNGTRVLTVIDTGGVTWSAEVQPLGLKAGQKPAVGTDRVGNVTKMGSYSFACNLLAGTLVGT